MRDASGGSDLKGAAELASACPVCGGPRNGGECAGCLFDLAASNLPEAEAPTVCGDYEILEEISRGGMGVVYRARQRSLDREVALKMVRGAEFADAETRRRFEREAHVAASLHHPHVVPVYEIGEWDLQPYFSMRLVPGRENIATWASRHRTEPRRLAAAAAQVARAVAYAHERGVLHRDLKPPNVLWDPEYGPQVTDFGLARWLEDGQSSLTRSDGILGSPAYMAPEQAAGGQAEVTTATDVHGLGAILYEMLTGQPPFRGRTSLEILRLVQAEPPERPSRLTRGLDRDLETICLRCLEKTPAHRYPSAREVAEELERCERGEPIRARPTSVGARLWRWSRRNPRLAALLLLCALLLIGGLAGVTWQWRTAEAARAGQERSLARLRWREVGRWLEEGETGRAVAYLASRLRTDPGHWQSAMYAMSIIGHHPFAVRVLPEARPAATPAVGARLSLDGTWYVSIDPGGPLRFVEVESGRETGRVAPTAPVIALAAATAQAAWAQADGEVRLTTPSGVAAVSCRRSLSGPVQGLTFSADGLWLLARSAAGLEIWKTAAPETSRGWPLTAPLGAALSADGARVLAWSVQEAVVWNVAEGFALGHWRAESKFRAGALSADGSCAALIDGTQHVRTWDLTNGREHEPIVCQGQVPMFLALSRDGRRLSVATRGHLIRIYDVGSGQLLSTLTVGGYYCDGLSPTADGSRVVSLNSSESVSILDAETGAPLISRLHLGTGAMDARSVELSSSRDGSRLLVTRRANDGATSLSVWRSTRPTAPSRRRVPGQVNFDGSRPSPDGLLGCLGLGPGNRLLVYELATGRERLDAPARGPVYVIEFSPDRQRIYAFTENGWLHGWDLRTKAELWTPRQQPGKVRPGAISPDGRILVAGHDDGFIRLYDAETGDLLDQLAHPGEIKVLRFAPDGSGRLLSASTDTLLHIWGLSERRILQTLRGHTGTVLAASWSPDARRIASASYDGTVRLWDVATGQLACPPLPHLAWMAHVEISPDGRFVATGCRDRTARLWDARTGKPVSAPVQFSGAVETVRFTRDGRALLVRHADGFQFLDVPGAEPVTVSYPEPSGSGVGMDAETFRDFLLPDGSVFLGTSMDYGVTWPVEHPRVRVPAWFPEALEDIANVRVDESGEFRPKAGASAAEWRQRVAGEDGPHARWLRAVLGERP